MSDELELPEGEPVEIEFAREGKPLQRGVLLDPLDDTRPGFELIEVRVPSHLGFGDPFTVEFQRKWINLSAVAEIRYLPPPALAAEVERLRRLHQEVRRRLESP